MKKLLPFYIIVLLLSCFFTTPLFAQSTSTQNITNLNKVEILESKVDVLNQTNEKILNTVYWALGGLITVFLAIVFFNFYQNFSLNKGKYDGLKQEIEADISAEKEKLELKVKEKLSSIDEENRKGLTVLNTNLDAKIKVAVDTSLKGYKTELEKIQAEYEDVKRDNLVRKAFDYKQESQMGYILNLIDVLDLDIKKKYDWRISETLDRISMCLEEGYKDGKSMEKLNSILSKLSPDFAFQKKNIEEKMRL